MMLGLMRWRDLAHPMIVCLIGHFPAINYVIDHPIANQFGIL